MTFFENLYQLNVACIILNAMLFIVFVLKSLMLGTHFVEQRDQTLSIEKNPKSYRLGDEATHNWTYKLKQYFQANRDQLVFDIAANSEELTLEEKHNSGSLGTLYGLNERSWLVKRSKVELIAKLVNMDRLQEVICNVNLISPTLDHFPHQYQANVHRLNSLRTDLRRRCALYLEKCFQMSETNKQRVIHPNIVYLKHLFVYHKSNVIAAHQTEGHKVLKEIQAANDLAKTPHMASLVLLVLPAAKLNLRLMMLCNWWQFTLKTTVEYGSQIAKGLDYLHVQMDMAHLNLKPENIIAFETQDFSSPNLHDRFELKLTDMGSASLLPTTTSVLSSSHKSSLYRLSPAFITPLTASPVELVYYDLHCYALTLLLMMVGYEQFSNCFMLATFPYNIIASPKSKIVTIIASYDKRMIPESFVDLFSLMFENETPAKSIFKTIVEQAAFKNVN